MNGLQSASDAASHPARTVPFDDLISGLEAALGRRSVLVNRHPEFPELAMYSYSNSCIFGDDWDEYTTLARGLVVDMVARRVVATPFPKFFSLGEKRGTPKELPFEAFEKVDGSLIVVWHHAGRWHCSTKGAFQSSQAVWAQAILHGIDRTGLAPGTTYLFEGVSVEHRIVIRPERDELVLLAGYAEDGRELSNAEITSIGEHLGVRVASRTAFASMAELVETTLALGREREGFVIRYADGSRLKAKGEAYRRIHALISGCTPLAVWESLRVGDDLAAIRRELPEEVQPDFDAIVGIYEAKLAEFQRLTVAEVAKVAHLADRDLAPDALDDGTLLPFVREYRRNGNLQRSRNALVRRLRPKANELPGYTPSLALNRIMKELAG